MIHPQHQDVERKESQNQLKRACPCPTAWLLWPFALALLAIFTQTSCSTMLYAIISQDVNNSLEKRLAARPAHLERLQLLKQQGRLILAGPHPCIDSEDPGEAGFSGSLVVAEFESLTDAQDWADSDPYIEAGVYDQVNEKAFKKVLP